MTDRAELPLLLTVEEAGAVLRVGRTKAYAMAQEWRVTDGRSGLPVIDLGNVLRVPRQALEELIGVELGGGSNGIRQRAGDIGTEGSESAITSTASRSTRPHRQGLRSDDEQLGLFAAVPPTT